MAVTTRKHTRSSDRARLERLFRENGFDITDCVHVAVDVQTDFVLADDKFYVDIPADKRRIAQRITKDIAPAFNDLGVPTYWVYFAEKNENETITDARKAYGGLYFARPLDGDRCVMKTEVSAFKGSDIDVLLKKDNKKLLIVTGFYTGACVEGTVTDARARGYQAVVLRDCTEDVKKRRRPQGWRKMTKAGALTASSRQVLSFLKNLSVAPL